MKQLSTMTFEQLLAMKAKIESAIQVRVDQERKRLTASLERLDTMADGKPRRGRPRGNGAAKGRTLEPKYRNPANPKETWAGRGLKPRWLTAALKGGKKKLTDFAVAGAKPQPAEAS